MPRKGPRSRAGTATATPPALPAVPQMPVAVPVSSGGRHGLDAFGIPALEREIEEHPERFRIVDVPLSDIVDSPINPEHRQQLDEEALADILPSVREFGVMSPLILVERDVLASNSPELEREIKKPGRYVIAAGHRRRAANALAGHDTAPAVVRNEFASERALTQILLFENSGRLGLTPLEEAEGFARLQKTGLSLQDIVKTVGGSVKSKSQVSRRLALLKLTPLGKQLLNREDITVDGALAVLTKLTDLPDSQDRALTAATSGPPASRPSLKVAIEHELRQQEEAAAADRLREQVAESGLPEIVPADVWGDSAWQHRLTTDDEVAEVREEGQLAGVTIVDGVLAYYSTDLSPAVRASVQPAPAEQAEVEQSSGGTSSAAAPDAAGITGVAAASPAPAPVDLEAQRAAQERRQAHHDASRKRREACSKLVGDFATFKDGQRSALIEFLSDSVLAGEVDKAVLRRPEVAQWADSSVKTEFELGEVIANDRSLANRLAFAAALASVEAQAADERYVGSRPWPPVVVRFITRLVDLGFHTLTQYEQDKLSSQ